MMSANSSTPLTTTRFAMPSDMTQAEPSESTDFPSAASEMTLVSGPPIFWKAVNSTVPVLHYRRGLAAGSSCCIICILRAPADLICCVLRDQW